MIIPEYLLYIIHVGIIAIMLGLFVSEKYPPVVIGIITVAIFLLIGSIDNIDLLSIALNPAPASIVGMFILSAALIRTGLLAKLSSRAQLLATNQPRLVIPLLLFVTLVLSAFVNNTPVVIMMIPVIISIAQKLDQPASRFLIPLSHAAILGGTCTLIGSSTNILVSGILESHGLDRIGMFEMSILGLAFAGVGAIYYSTIGRHLLPDHKSFAQISTPSRFITDVLIHPDSPLVGKTLEEVSFFHEHNITVVDIIRSETSLLASLDTIAFKPRDHLILESSASGVISLKEGDYLNVGGLSTIIEKEAMVIEALISSRSPLLTKKLHDARIQHRYGVCILALHRHGANLGRNFANIRLNAADTILVEGAREDILRLSEDMELVNLSEPSSNTYRSHLAPIAAITLIAVVTLSALNLLPLLTLLTIAVAVLLATRCLEIEDVFDAIDWPIIILLVTMLAIGQAMQNSGTLAWLLEGASPFFTTQSPYIVLGILFLMTSIMTEMISNTAVATLMTPFAIGLGISLGYDPRPLALVVMIAASASFSTPIGYQTNTLVYNPGGYKFTDFLIVGVPMNLIIGILTVLLLPMWWPL